MRCLIVSVLAVLGMLQAGFAEQVKPTIKEAVAVVASTAKKHPKNAAGSDLIAQKDVRFILKKYADGSTLWVPMPDMRTVVSKAHVKIYNEQALKALPQHLQEAHEKHDGSGIAVSKESSSTEAKNIVLPVKGHPKNVAGSELIAETQLRFMVNTYADGSVVWVPMPGMKTFVSKDHVKIYNEQALKSLPSHLHAAHKEHAKGKNDEEVASLYVGGLGVLFGDARTQAVEGAMVGDAIKFVGSAVSGNVTGAGKAVLGFGKHLASGIMQLSQPRPGFGIPSGPPMFPVSVDAYRAMMRKK